MSQRQEPGQAAPATRPGAMRATRSLSANVGVVACGVLMCLLVAAAHAAAEYFLHFNLFGLMLWFVLPAGALLVGGAAASGYYLGSLFFHQKATKLLLAEMAIVAGATQFLIYWLGYALAVHRSGHTFAEVIPFRDYLGRMLTHSHYSMGVNGTPMLDVGETGDFGYVLAAIQFVGFVAGSVMVWSRLRLQPVCQPCDLYLRRLARNVKHFDGSESANGFFRVIFTLPMGSPEFAQLMRRKPVRANRFKVKHGAALITTTLLGCPGCRQQVVNQTVRRFQGREWKDDRSLTRNVRVPDAVDLRSSFLG